MANLSFMPVRYPLGAAGRSRGHGFTLVETMVSLAVLVVAAFGGSLSFMMLNRYAASLRNLSTAKELCQERIEQVRSMPFSPPNTVPYAPGQDGNYYFFLGMPGTTPTNLPTGTTTVPAAGTASDYSTSGQFTGASGKTTLVEPVTIYASRDGTTASAITGTRTTSISLSSFVDTNVTLPVTSLNLIQFVVTVSYTFRGQTYSYSMYTMRGPD